jgi:lysozyme family protein
MANIKNFLTKLLKIEGGYVNHPNDSGGCTNKGITIGTFRDFFGKDKTCDNLKNISDSQVEKIYKQEYWDKCKCDEIQCPKIAQLIADWAVNSGVKTAIKCVQNIVKVNCDGIIGPITLKAINNYPTKDLFNELKKARKEYYENLVKKTPSNKVFLKGWINRLEEYKWCE